jgi:hypothetical protein
VYIVRHQIYINGLCTYPITTESKQTEKSTVKDILQRNEYNTMLLEKLPSQPQKQNIHEDPKDHKVKWSTFAYCGKEVRQLRSLNTRNLE